MKREETKMSHSNKTLEETPKIGSIVTELVAEIEQRRNENKIIRTGITKLDNMLGGLNGGELLLLGAAPSINKTSCALNIVHSVSKDYKTPCAYFSMKENSRELVIQMISIDSAVNYDDIKSGRISEGEWSNVIDSTNTISNLPIFLMDNNLDITVSYLKSECHKLKEDEDIGLIIVDYLQLISAGGDVKQPCLDEVVNDIKDLAIELDIPIILLADLDLPDSEIKSDDKLDIAVLNNIGAMEHYADIVLYIQQKKIDEIYRTHEFIDLVVVKNYRGETGTIPTVYYREAKRWK